MRKRYSISFMPCMVLIMLSWQTVFAHPGDPDSGKALYAQCMGCHSLGSNRTGPRHCGLLGRKAGSVRGFEYSDAMRMSGIVWNAKQLDAFLQSPSTKVPGTNMPLFGIKNAQDRRDLIAFLKRAGMSDECKSAADAESSRD